MTFAEGLKANPSSPCPRPCPCHPRRQRAKLMATPGTTEEQLCQGLPLNAQLLQTTLGVTSEGFQDALNDAIFCGGMLPPGDPEEVGALGVFS